MTGQEITTNESIKELLKTRYYLDGEDWEGLCRRVARTIAAVEKTAELRKEWEEKFFEVIFSKKFLPNSPVLFGAGRQRHTLSACFVIPISDNIDGILEAQNRAVKIFKSGGGVGINFSKIRPAGHAVSSGGTSSGPVKFLKLFDVAGEVIKQGGRRRSAQMSILHCKHPDIFDFIDAKKEPGRLNNMNLSVALTNEFMVAATENKTWTLQYNNFKQEITASKILDHLALRAWESGEPGVFFIDQANADNSCSNISKIEACNPCGENPLRPDESCTLGSIDVSKFVRDGVFMILNYFDTIKTAVRFLDNTIDANYFPDAKIDNATKKTRPIGLGIMGFADYLIKMQIRYGSDESLSAIEDILFILKESALECSELLGEEKGSFPAFCESKFFKNYPKIKHLRNSQLLSIAPTGSISKIAGCSSGIEPIFTFATESRLTAEGKKLSIPSRWKHLPSNDYKISAQEIDYKDHIRILSVAQRYVDTGISKTINLPASATIEDVKKSIVFSWESGCKGITVFRDNCARAGVIEEYCINHPEQILIGQGKCHTCPICGWSNKCNVA